MIQFEWIIWIYNKLKDLKDIERLEGHSSPLYKPNKVWFQLIQMQNKQYYFDILICYFQSEKELTKANVTVIISKSENSKAQCLFLLWRTLLFIKKKLFQINNKYFLTNIKIVLKRDLILFIFDRKRRRKDEEKEERKIRAANWSEV